MFAYCNNNPVIMEDSEGAAAVMAAVAITAGIIGFAVSAVSTMIDNSISGDSIWDGVLASGLGGATYNVVSVVTCGNPVAAGFASALVESVTGEIVDYATGKNELTKENLAKSASSVFGNTLLKGSIYACTGKIADKILPIDLGKMVSRSVLKSDLINIAKQTATQSAEYLLGKKVYDEFTSFGMVQ